MPTKLLWSGLKHMIYGWVEGQSCTVEQFLRNLASDGNFDAENMERLLSGTAEHGPPHNPEKYHPVRGPKGKGLYEFKARGGARVLAFHNLKKIICTHGIPKFKPKRFEREVERAGKIRDAYVEEETKKRESEEKKHGR